MSSTAINLDKLAAERAQAMVKAARDVKSVKKPVDTLERLATKTLGVLQEQGVYAMMLFLFSRSSDEGKIAPLVRTQLFAALKSLPAFKDAQNVPAEKTNTQDTLKFYADKVLDNLDTLLLVRDLYEQTLIYARYGAKAAGG